MYVLQNYFWLGYGLECQQCGQKGNGLCFDFDDNGETVECRDGLDACWLYQISKNHLTNHSTNILTWYAFLENEVEGTEETFRTCGTNLEESTESCFNQTINGVSFNFWKAFEYIL